MRQYNYCKPAQVENSWRVIQVRSIYSQPIPWEWKLKMGVQFSQFAPILKQCVKVPSVGSAKLEGIVSNARHHLPHRVKGPQSGEVITQ